MSPNGCSCLVRELIRIQSVFIKISENYLGTTCLWTASAQDIYQARYDHVPSSYTTSFERLAIVLGRLRWSLNSAAERESLADMASVNSYQTFVETDKAGYLIRQWIGSNLYDRVR